jgi:hypothetical protein
MAQKIAIATITWARDPDEESLLRSSLPHLAASGLPVFITDGGSGASFISFLKSFPQFTILTTAAKGVWAQAGNSIRKAHDHGADFILYTEPDKKDFFEHALQDLIQLLQDNTDAGIILASRSASAFATFPAFQQMTETTINNCCTEITGNRQDYTYGPFLMNRKLIPSLDLVKEDIGWGWRPYVFIIAQRLGLRISNVTGEYHCPVSQRQDTASERIYRMKQLQQNIHGMVLAANVDLIRISG